MKVNYDDVENFLNKTLLIVKYELLNIKWYNNILEQRSLKNYLIFWFLFYFSLIIINNLYIILDEEVNLKLNYLSNKK